MATRNGQAGSRLRGHSRVSFGTFTLSGAERQPRLSITKDLDGYDFPNEKGQDVRVELIECDDGDDYLEVHPVQD